METFKPIKKLSKKWFSFALIFQLQTATLIFLVMVGFVGSLLIDGFLASKNFSQISGLQIPRFTHIYYILFPTVISLIISLVTIKLSPQQKPWSRLIIISIIFILTGRYLLWRSLSTINLSTTLNGIISVGVFLMEILMIVGYIFQLYLLLKVKPRHRQADEMSIAVIEGKYNPSVDILIPTFNEPIMILKRTVIGCQALDYCQKKIYILDDTQREEVKQLARELGCEYIIRPDNRYAKAGNLNHALTKTSGELIIVFDADFVPTTNFITRTIGFFQNPQIGLLQTYQSFYNPDPIARNLGIEDLIPRDVERFYRYIQVIKDGVEGSICAGTSFVVRRSYLKEIGGFITDSLSEDLFTGIRLTAQGYKLIYLGESLSAGLSAENMRAYIQQQLRWCRGTLQAFFIKENPLTIPGLKFSQRLAHLEAIVQWFFCIFQVLFLMMPLIFSFLRIIPVQSTLNEWVYYFIPFYLVQLATFSWLNFRSRSALISGIYEVANCFPISVNIIQTLLSPFSVNFQVTPKGIYNNRFKFNWKLAFPLIMFFILNFFSLGSNMILNWHSQSEGIGLVWIWGIYNLIIIILALFAMFDVPQKDIYEWFNLRKPVRIFNENNSVQGITTKLSEGGAEIELSLGCPKSFTQIFPLNSSVKLEILETGLTLQSKVSKIKIKDNLQIIKLEFEQVNLQEYRGLVELLFCRPGRWKFRQTPGELHSFWLLLRALFKPKFLNLSLIRAQNHNL